MTNTRKRAWKPLELRAFCEEVASYLSAHGWPSRVVIDGDGDEGDEKITVSLPDVPDAEQTRVYPHNFYRYYQNGERLEDVCARIREQLTASVVEARGATPTWDEALPRLVVQLVTERTADHPLKTIARPSRLPGLDLEVVLDYPTHFVIVTEGMLENWGRSAGEVVALAVIQTLPKLPPWRASEIDSHRFWAIESGAGLAATAIAFPEKVAEVGVPGEQLWLACPCRDVAFVFEDEASGTEAPTMSRFITLAAAFVAKTYQSESHPRSPWLYRVYPNGQVDACSAIQVDKQPTVATTPRWGQAG